MDNIPDKIADGDVIQQAVSRRVARLASMPVDTNRLDEMLRRQVGHRPQRLPMWLWWTTPLAGVAAALAIIAVMLSSSVHRISATDLARVYSHLTASSHQLGNGMARMNAMPMKCRLMPGEMAICCRQMVAHQNLACMLIKTPSARPVVLVACNMRRAEMPAGKAMTIAGHRDTISRSGNVNMVMRQANGRWLCALGTQSPAVLDGYLDRAVMK